MFDACNIMIGTRRDFYDNFIPGTSLKHSQYNWSDGDGSGLFGTMVFATCWPRVVVDIRSVYAHGTYCGSRSYMILSELT